MQNLRRNETNDLIYKIETNSIQNRNSTLLLKSTKLLENIGLV